MAKKYYQNNKNKVQAKELAGSHKELDKQRIFQEKDGSDVNSPQVKSLIKKCDEGERADLDTCPCENPETSADIQDLRNNIIEESDIEEPFNLYVDWFDEALKIQKQNFKKKLGELTNEFEKEGKLKENKDGFGKYYEYVLDEIKNKFAEELK